ncbi:MAG TPA: NYN domain-containing protein [Acidimicrobiales bacterium]|nr:NYN domain-containing protein [Acidimicrobiales bacterium]
MAGTCVYIDGYNLYYRALKGTPHKWLNLEEFCDRLLPNDDVVKIRYFTAKVKDTPLNIGAQQRQQFYWRALSLLPRVEMHLGLYQTKAGWRLPHKVNDGIRPRPEMLSVKLQEEKGSDVNLASWLLLDAFRGTFDTAVVISNDSDLREPVRMVKDEIGLPVGIVNPNGGRKDALTGTFRREIRAKHLTDGQFPITLQDGTGPFHRPPTWT